MGDMGDPGGEPGGDMGIDPGVDMDMGVGMELPIIPLPGRFVPLVFAASFSILVTKLLFVFCLSSCLRISSSDLKQIVL